MKKAETKDRIKEALDVREMKQSELVERTGIDKGQMSSYLAGRYKPKQTNLNLIAEALSVDEAWLMGYDVPMERESRSLIVETPDPNNEINIILAKIQKGEQLSASEQEKISAHLDKAWPQFTQSFQKLGNTLAESHLKRSFDLLNYENKSKVINYSQNLLQIQEAEEEQEYLIPKAAHERTDIEITEEMRKHDDDLMDNDELWK